MGLNGANPVARQPLLMFAVVIALCLARMYMSVHSARLTRPASRRETASVSAASARFNGAKTPTSSGLQDVRAMRWQYEQINSLLHLRRVE